MLSSPVTRTFSGSRCIAGSIAGCFFITHSRCAPSTAARRPLSANTHKTLWREVFFSDISQQTAALNDTLVQFTIMSRPTQTMASISFASQANISPEAPGRHPKQTPPFFIIPLGFGDLGALFHYTATIISQRKLKSFNL